MSGERGVTLVTGLFDLARREPTVARPGPDAYFERGRLVLDLDVDLVVFADPELTPEVEERRAAGREITRLEISGRPSVGTARSRPPPSLSGPGPSGGYDIGAGVS